MEAKVTFRLSYEGQRDAATRGLNAAKQQEIIGQIRKDQLDLCRITQDGKVVCSGHFEIKENLRIVPLTGQLYGCITPEFDRHPETAEAALDEYHKVLDKAVKERREQVEKAKREKEKERQGMIAWAKKQIRKIQDDPDYKPPHIASWEWDLINTEPEVADKLRKLIEDHEAALRQRAAERREAEEKAKRLALLAALIKCGATENQLERFDNDMLPESEIRELFAAVAFKALDEKFKPFSKITDSELVDVFLEQHVGYEKSYVASYGKTSYWTHPASSATAEQWEKLKQVKEKAAKYIAGSINREKAEPSAADVFLLWHIGTISFDESEASIERISVRVKAKAYGFTLIRDYAC